MKVSIVTASFEEGDAIGNYIRTLSDLLGELGFSVEIYAENLTRVRGYPHFHWRYYNSRGKAILWYHYSIYSETLQCLKSSRDWKVVDFHGVSPPRLFSGYNSHLEELCSKGELAFKDFAADADVCVVHSDYARDVARANGYANIEKIPLVVDTKHLGTDDAELSALLGRIEYLLFVGRVVPQKSIVDLVTTFGELKKWRPGIKLFIVGETEIAASYFGHVRDVVRRLKLEEDVVFTGRVTNPEVLSSLYRHARFSLCLSEWESFCVPIVESMFFGVPVVANNVAPIPEVLGTAGLIVRKDDHAATARSIHETLSDGDSYAGLKSACAARASMFTEHKLKAAIAEMLGRRFG
ncbi:MAG: glycosyltransferase family 4 protein [Chloroflexi bacterium]|nr:glycosyltransferase family 4 protein [Chloroflexota bacterium]